MIAPVLTAQLFGVQPLFLLLLLLGEKSLGFLHSPGQPLRDVAFQHKICYRIFDSGFGVGKIRIRRQKNHLDWNLVLRYIAGDVQAVGAGHSDIGYDDIHPGGGLLQKADDLLAVGAPLDNRAIQPFPIH